MWLGGLEEGVTGFARGGRSACGPSQSHHREFEGIVYRGSNGSEKNSVRSDEPAAGHEGGTLLRRKRLPLGHLAH